MKALNLQSLTNVQVEILQGLLKRSIYEFEQLSDEDKDIAREACSYDPLIELQTIYKWTVFNN